jgi:hypothetical protein
MTLLDTVKRRLGVFYSESGKDAEIQGMIDSAIEYFKGAGWNISASDTSPTVIEAIVLFCKMAQSTDVVDFTNHPVLISFIAQGRAEVEA